jgi:hypothetical protein
MSNTIHATIVTDALMMAVKRMSPSIGLVYLEFAVCNLHVMHVENFSMGMAWHGAEHEPCRQLLRQRHD